ncbi:LysM domain-containing protein [Pseudoscourfieldia marina]
MMIVNSYVKPRVLSSRAPSSLTRRCSSYRASRFQAKASNSYYTVQRGDWLSNIAPKYNVSVEDIKQANASVLGEESVIYPGQKLVIPGGDAGAGTLKTVVALGAAAAAAVFVLLRKK